MIEIYTLGDDVLRKDADAVENIDETIISIAQEMVEKLGPAKGIGLAAPQIGLLKQMFVTRVDGDIPRVFINPSIIQTSPDLIKYEEGCLSIPGVYADILRPAMVSIQAWNEKGKPFTLDAEGMLARVIQHEFDHLKGVLFIDHLSERKKEKITKAYYKNRSK